MSSDPARRARAAAIGDMSRGRGIEIGPLDAPIASRDRYDVRYVDVVGTDALREKYADDPNVSNEEIVAVDFSLLDDFGAMRSLAEAAARDAPYDWVVASHVIEHVPDLIDWLDSIAEVLVDDGQLLLMIPDRRFSFDSLRPQTTMGQILQAHTQGDTVPSERAVFDHFRSYVSVPTPELWAGRSAKDYPKEFDLDVAQRMRGRSIEDGEYIDSHVWLFTPADFVDQIVELGRLGLCDLVIDRITATAFNELEFYVALRRIPRGLDSEAVALKRAGSVEAFVEPRRAETDLASGAPPTPPTASAGHELSELERKIIDGKRNVMKRARTLLHRL